MCQKHRGATEEDVPRFKIIFPRGGSLVLGECSEEEAKAQAKIKALTRSGVQLIRITSYGGQEIEF